MVRKNRISNFDRDPTIIMPGFVWAFFLWAILIQAVDFYFYKFKRFELNERIIFGLWGNNPLAFLVSIFLLVFIYLIFWSKSGPDKVCLLLVCAVMSNLLDRIFYHGVVDYIFIGNWPAFNFADVLMVIALVARIIVVIRGSK